MKTHIQNLFVTLVLLAGLHRSTAQTLTNIVITPANPVIAVGSNQQFTATGKYNDGSSQVLTNSGSPGGSWASVAGMPSAKSGVASAGINGELYVVGGAENTLVYNYNPVANVWVSKASIPGTYRAYSGAAGIGNKLYIMGGCINSDCNTTSSGLDVYDAATDSWSSAASMSVPRSQMGVGVINGKIYVAGGRQYNSSGIYNSLEVYNPTINGWTTKASMPTVRSDCGAAVINGILYIVGGQNNGVGLGTVEAYDPISNTWTTKASMPTPRTALGVCAAGGLIYAINGYSGVSATNLVEVYNPVTDSWFIGVPTVTAHVHHQPVTLNGTMYIVGTGPNNNAITNAEAYMPQNANSLWSSSVPAVATISTNGVATGVTNGTTTITATSGSVSNSTTLTVFSHVTTWYVWTNSPANGPGVSWATAFHDIQSAVNMTTNGDTVLVTNGFYNTGGGLQSSGYYLTNRVYITNNIILKSVNGPIVTTISGEQPLYANNAYSNAVRCVYIGTNAMLSGFTLTNGYTYAGITGMPLNGIDGSGGGVWSVSTGIISNCVITGCWQYGGSGGGGYGGTLYNCTLIGNSGYENAGAGYSTLNNCTIINNGYSGNGSHVVGGAYYCILNNCLVSGNKGGVGGVFSCVANYCKIIGNVGGGVAGSVINNSLISSNIPYGASGGSLNNCTIVSNTFSVNYSPSHGVIGGAALTNCIVYLNSGDVGPNYDTFCTFAYCCTTPLPTNGVGNTSFDPLFANSAAGNFHLLSNSPCINVGYNAAVVGTTDLDGNPRIIGGIVDMGAYENQSVVVTPPTISMQPTNNTVSPNGTVTLGVTATGSGLSYQWRLNGTNIAGATFATYTIPSVNSTNVGVYTVVVSNAGGSVTSQAAIVGTTDIKMFAGVIVNGPLGTNYIIQSTTNLSNINAWTIRTNLALPSQPYIYIDYSSPTNWQQFYRAYPQ